LAGQLKAEIVGEFLESEVLLEEASRGKEFATLLGISICEEPNELLELSLQGQEESNLIMICKFPKSNGLDPKYVCSGSHVKIRIPP